MNAVVVIVAGALLALPLALLRLVRGPAQADRIVALDVILSVTIALTAAAALATGRELFLDIAVGLAMVAFVATIVWARLVESWAERKTATEGEEPSP